MRYGKLLLRYVKAKSNIRDIWSCKLKKNTCERVVRSTRTAVQEILVGATIQTAVLVSGDHSLNSKMFRSWTSWYGSKVPAGVKSEELILVERWGTQKISENPFGCEF